MSFYDAHCHLHFKELNSVGLVDYWKVISKASVNGTSPKDWDIVSSFYSRNPDQVVPSLGVHPWEVRDLDREWKSELIQHLELHPNAGLGEIGLDKWIKGYDMSYQKVVFQAQLEIAQYYNRVVSIHCIKAWGTLKTTMESYIGRPYLLHAYSGPSEYISYFIDKGAYFSFSPSFLYDRKTRVLDMFKNIPLDRLLIETDSPSMLGPQSTWAKSQYHMQEGVQHPQNIVNTYIQVSKHLGIEIEELS